MKTLSVNFLTFVFATLVASIGTAGEAEVLHFWTSPGEAKSVDELRVIMAKRGHVWKDFSVVGGGGQNAMTALKERVVSGKPPAAASIKGPAIQEWAKLNSFANLDLMASVEKWDQNLPKFVQEHVKYKGSYIAVPVNIHRANWMWTNTQVLEKSGVTKTPTTFEEFLMGVGGKDLYQNALMKLEPAALSSPAMQKSLEMFRKLKAYTDDKSNGRDWNDTTDMVIKSKAAFQFMGDWAKGEFLVAGQTPGKEFTCSATPGSNGAFVYVVDSFAMFQLKSWEAQKAQGYLAYVMLGQQFQESFNLRKGSIPARTDVSLNRFDSCAKAARSDMDQSMNSGNLLPSVAVDMALPTKIHSEIRATVSEYWNNEQLTASQTMAKLSKLSMAK